jgi:hypothetical protein
LLVFLGALEFFPHWMMCHVNAADPVAKSMFLARACAWKEMFGRRGVKDNWVRALLPFFVYMFMLLSAYPPGKSISGNLIRLC